MDTVTGITGARRPIQTFQLQAKLFRGFSDRSRLAILETLRHGARAVGDIAAATGLTQPNVSNHLKCLSECGLVIGEQKGRFTHYRLCDARIAQLLELADELLAGSAHRILNCTNYREDGSAGEAADQPAGGRERRRIQAKA